MCTKSQGLTRQSQRFELPQPPAAWDGVRDAIDPGPTAPHIIRDFPAIDIAPLVGADADLAEQAANLAKADLRSAMVGEFPELQGLMGMYYAKAAGEDAAIAHAAKPSVAANTPSATPQVPIAPAATARAPRARPNAAGAAARVHHSPANIAKKTSA